MLFKTSVFAVCTLLFVALINANPADQVAEILRYENDNIGVDGYKFEVETSDGTLIQANGELKELSDGPAIVARGQYTYTAPDGQQYTVSYVADENGFQPQGAHLPVA
ncbi:hypothetical protein KR093_009204 [Drosophila rubida]|uniref:Larval cuticle protein 65Ag1-like n=1 Tax=Drosophila rubida TaxID=30044 RepID=A0AAD4JWQ7_9MUSC|nr:hypothetical protein KR093_009204 [Drosophila rubida]